MDLILGLMAESLSEYSYLGLFLILAVGGLGLPIPEELTLLAAGLFVAWGTTDLVPTLVVCGVGMALGDFIFFAIGRRFGEKPLHGVLGRLAPPDRVYLWLRKVRRSGLLVVFFGRYLTGVRPAVFLAAGAARIPVRRFLLVDGASAIVSLFFWVLLGRYFSDYIELALFEIQRIEHLIIAAIVGIVLVLAGEQALIRIGRLSPLSPWVRVMKVSRVPILLLSAGLAVLVAREHGLTRRAQLVAAASAVTPAEIDDLGTLFRVLPRLGDVAGPIDLVMVADDELLDSAFLRLGYRTAEAADGVMFGRAADRHLIGGYGTEIHAWRSPYRLRRGAVWLGRLGDASAGDVTRLRGQLVESGAVTRTSLGPRLPAAEHRVLVAVLRHRELSKSSPHSGL